MQERDLYLWMEAYNLTGLLLTIPVHDCPYALADNFDIRAHSANLGVNEFVASDTAFTTSLRTQTVRSPWITLFKTEKEALKYKELSEVGANLLVP